MNPGAVFYIGNDPTCEITRNMKKESDRLLTFTDWPHHYLDPKDLAKAGLYSTHYEDAVRCAFCNVEICRWEEGDNPMADHQRWSNDCPFIRRFNVGNIPMDPDDVVELPRRVQDICNRYGIQVRPNSVPERSNQNLDLSALGVTHKCSSAYPNYATLEARLRTFKEWPLSIKQKSKELAGAGFFYINKGDQTMCFSCGGGLKDWLEADDPWVQHARWFTKCSFVLMVKGREFIREVSNRLPAFLTAQQGADLQSPTVGSTSKSGKPVSVQQGTGLQSPTAGSTSKSGEPVFSLISSGEGNSKPEDGRLCKICYMEELGVVFLPCGHIVACVKCVQSLSTCAVCRQPFTATVRAFLS